MHTEEEARKLWCPFARVTQSGGEAGNRYAFDHDASQQAPFARCLASACMAWRSSGWSKNGSGVGYCGLAGED